MRFGRDLLLCLVLCACITFTANTQIYHMVDEASFSTSFANMQPAGFEDEYPYAVKVFLPSVFVGFSQDGPSLYDLIKKDSEGEYFLSTSNSKFKLKPENAYRSSTIVNTIGASVNIKEWSFSFGHAIRAVSNLNFPNDTYTLFDEGNASFIGEEISVGVAFQGTTFNQYGFGVSYGSDVARIGVKLKYLNGIQDISTAQNGVRLFTDEDIYQLRFTNNYIINSSSLLDFNDFEDYNINLKRNYLNSFFTKNTGLGLDVGIALKISEQTLFSVAVFDIGKIRWKEQVKNYRSKGGFSFEGVDIAEYIGNETVVTLRDSLLNLLKFETTEETYTSRLPLQYNISFSHTVNEKVDLTAAFNLASFNGFSYYNLRLSSFYDIASFAKVGASYTYNPHELLNLGLMGIFKVGMVQMFARTDNILGVVYPLKNGFTNLHVGFNLLVGSTSNTPYVE